jgi:hypothetical protein
MKDQNRRVATRTKNNRSIFILGVLALASSLGIAGCMGADGPENNAPTIEAADEDVVEESSTTDPDARMEKGGATSSCLGLWASGTSPNGGPNSVSGRCFTRDGKTRDSQAWLPGCMGNDNGQLVWGGRYFDRSCRDCRLEMALPLPATYRMSCECRRGDGRWVWSSMIVSDYLTNNDGYLTCD